MEVLAAAIHWGSKDFHTMGGKDKRRRTASVTPWDGIPESELTPAQSIVAASHRSMYAFRHEYFDGDAAFFNGYPRDECPFCGGATRPYGRKPSSTTAISAVSAAGCRRPSWHAIR